MIPGPLVPIRQTLGAMFKLVLISLVMSLGVLISPVNLDLKTNKDPVKPVVAVEVKSDIVDKQSIKSAEADSLIPVAQLECLGSTLEEVLGNTLSGLCR